MIDPGIAPKLKINEGCLYTAILIMPTNFSDVPLQEQASPLLPKRFPQFWLITIGKFRSPNSQQNAKMRIAGLYSSLSWKNFRSVRD
jgi:hypothetical protein